MIGRRIHAGVASSFSRGFYERAWIKGSRGEKCLRCSLMDCTNSCPVAKLPSLLVLSKGTSFPPTMVDTVSARLWLMYR